MSVSGHCLCGAVSYTAGAPLPLSTAVCNCKDCQRSSGSAFATVVPVRTSTFKLTGELGSYRNTGTDSGENRDRKFCPNCGSQILSVLHENPEITWLKAGTLDDKSKVSPMMEVWTSSAQGWTSRLPKRVHIKRGPPKLMVTSLKPALKALSKVGGK
jgi:hypothetical protein